jgi:hypothetical protein
MFRDLIRRLFRKRKRLDHRKRRAGVRIAFFQELRRLLNLDRPDTGRTRFARLAHRLTDHEPLEERVLLAYDVTLEGTALTIEQATDADMSNLTVSLADGVYTIIDTSLTFKAPGGPQSAYVTVDPTDQMSITVSADTPDHVDTITINTFDGDDIITISSVGADSITVNGGANNDIIDVGTAITGNVAGGAGSDDTLQGTAIDDVVLTGSTSEGFDGDEASISGGFTGFSTITGNGGSLTGYGNTTWGLGNNPTYTKESTGAILNFSGFDTLQGGSSVDTFNVAAASDFDLKGGDGDDIFNISQTLTGNIAGEAGNEQIKFISGGTVSGNVDGGTSATLDFSALAGPVAIGLTAPGTIDGFQGTAPTVGSFDNITTVIGSTGNDDTLTGDDAVGVWNLGGTQTYTDSGATRTLTFSDIETLQGSTAADTFNVTMNKTLTLKGGGGADIFDVDANLTGSIDGEADGDTLQGSQIDAVTLTGAVGDGFSGTETSITASFANIEILAGTSGTLTGQDAVSTWRMDGSPTYAAGASNLQFSGFATLQGGSDVDNFDVVANSTFNLKGGGGADDFDVDATLTGSIDGEADTDTLQGSQIDAATLTGAVGDGFSGTETSITASFANIEILTGTSGTLTGQDAVST